MVVLPGIFQEGLKKAMTNLRTASVSAEIRNENLPNTSPQRYCYTKHLAEKLRICKIPDVVEENATLSGVGVTPYYFSTTDIRVLPFYCNKIQALSITTLIRYTVI
jgi:hypothetical protein